MVRLDKPQHLIWRERIQGHQRAIETLQQEIEAVAKRNITDYHFLDYSVSTFWTCDKSPIGMCVFNLDDYCRRTECRYCGDPDERK